LALEKKEVQLVTGGISLLIYEYIIIWNTISRYMRYLFVRYDVDIKKCVGSTSTDMYIHNSMDGIKSFD